MTHGIRGLIPFPWLITAFAFTTMSIGWFDRDNLVNNLNAPGASPNSIAPSIVTIEKKPDGSFAYLVNGSPELFIGMGYNPIYRYLSDPQRAANYDRDFRLLCEVGVNHITGWDSDKGYDQDRFDELTLDSAHKYGIGVIMPYYLPTDANYDDPQVQSDLMAAAAEKVWRFRNHPALRMWGVGNEVLSEMDDPETRYSFLQFYLRLADLFHALDPDHPVIYREAEDEYVPEIIDALNGSGMSRPWLLYGMNIYNIDIDSLLAAWPEQGMDGPLFVSEFGAEPDWPGGRTYGYVRMWQTIRSYPRFVLGGAPYAWTTAGPEPTDVKWGLMDTQSRPADGTFAQLALRWRTEPERGRCP